LCLLAFGLSAFPVVLVGAVAVAYLLTMAHIWSICETCKSNHKDGMAKATEMTPTYMALDSVSMICSFISWLGVAVYLVWLGGVTGRMYMYMYMHTMFTHMHAMYVHFLK
jgi:hypothetical protein